MALWLRHWIVILGRSGVLLSFSRTSELSMSLESFPPYCICKAWRKLSLTCSCPAYLVQMRQGLCSVVGINRA